MSDLTKALDLVGYAIGNATEAQSQLRDDDFDAEGPLANAIQQLTVALTRDLKKESTRD
jgi:hypothetical protein